jgi:hypothetical protein
MNEHRQEKHIIRVISQAALYLTIGGQNNPLITVVKHIDSDILL